MPFPDQTDLPYLMEVSDSRRQQAGDVEKRFARSTGQSEET